MSVELWHSDIFLPKGLIYNAPFPVPFRLPFVSNRRVTCLIFPFFHRFSSPVWLGRVPCLPRFPACSQVVVSIHEVINGRTPICTQWHNHNFYFLISQNFIVIFDGTAKVHGHWKLGYRELKITIAVSMNIERNWLILCLIQLFKKKGKFSNVSFRFIFNLVSHYSENWLWHFLSKEMLHRISNFK